MLHGKKMICKFTRKAACHLHVILQMENCHGMLKKLCCTPSFCEYNLPTRPTCNCLLTPRTGCRVRFKTR